MPALVEKTGEGKYGGIWEVKWTWLPAFLAMDSNLTKLVDKKLNRLFAGGDPPMPKVLDAAVINTICEHYPMPGLKEVLQAIQKVDPTAMLQLVNEVTDEAPSSEMRIHEG